MSEPMVLLQCFNRFDRIGALDIATGAWREYSKSAHPQVTASPRCGVFSVIDGRQIGLFRLDGTLRLWAQTRLLRLCTQNRLFILTPDVTSSWDLRGPRAVFRLERGTERLFALHYRAFQSRRLIPGDDTPFVDEEDYDFLLFVRRVLTDSERRARLFIPELRG